jgi:hypothetical protein
MVLMITALLRELERSQVLSYIVLSIPLIMDYASVVYIPMRVIRPIGGKRSTYDSTCYPRIEKPI